MKRRITTLRKHLQLLTLGTLLPMLALVIVGTAVITERERTVAERGAMDRTRALLTAVDAELRGQVDSLRLLAEPLNSNPPELQSFHDVIIRTLPTQTNWYRVDLADPSGQRVIDSQFEFGSPIPPVVDEASFEQVRRNGSPLVSDLFLDGGEHHFAVRQPVMQGGELLYVLSAIVEPEAILDLLRFQQLPSDWVGVVVDGNGRIVARTVEHDRWFGQPASESLRSAIALGPEGWFEGRTLEGREVYTPHLTSSFSGWTVAFGIPKQAIEAGETERLTFIAVGLVIALTVALINAGIVSRRISRPIAAVTQTAKALGRGEPISPPDAGSVAEVHEMGVALMDAAEEVYDREERLREADRAKDNFLAMLGHELRNPLSALSSASQVLQITDKKEGPASHAAAIIDRQVRHMARMVDDLLDVARLTTGKIKLDQRPLDLSDCVASAMQDLRTAGALENHDVCLDLSPAWLAGDEARIDQIVTNLVHNAVKYTPVAGRIDVRVFASKGKAILEVADTGSGLSADLAPRIFDLFVQGEQTMDRTSGGLGVGLTLVRHIAELHGGEAHAHSEGPDRGTCVTISFPGIDQPGEATEPPEQGEQDPAQGETILLIEDNADARQALRQLLELQGYEVLEAPDGAAGLEIAESARPPIAVIDIGLPGINGLQVAHRLRDKPDGDHVVLIAVSGYGRPGLRKRALRAGFDDLLTKPVTPGALIEAITTAFRERSESGEGYR